MSYTLAEVAERTGKTEANLRKMIERGQLRAHKEGNKLMVEDEDLDAMEGVQVLTEATEAVRDGRTGEIGNIFTRMPNRLAQAILEGMGSSKPAKAPNPDPVRKVMSEIPKTPVKPVPPEEEDPHRGFPVGHQHVDAPRWKRTTKTTWKLDDATYTWNGFLWEGGGVKEGIALEPGISPADPDVSYRPLAPAGAKAK
jgi:excisionase family DNA binding protein